MPTKLAPPREIFIWNRIYGVGGRASHRAREPAIYFVDRFMTSHLYGAPTKCPCDREAITIAVFPFRPGVNSASLVASIRSIKFDEFSTCTSRFRKNGRQKCRFISTPLFLLASCTNISRLFPCLTRTEKKKGTKDKFCAINYRDRLGRESESIRLRSTTCEKRRNERRKVDVPTLCHGPAEFR